MKNSRKLVKVGIDEDAIYNIRDNFEELLENENILKKDKKLIQNALDILDDYHFFEDLDCKWEYKSKQMRFMLLFEAEQVERLREIIQTLKEAYKYDDEIYELLYENYSDITEAQSGYIPILWEGYNLVYEDDFRDEDYEDEEN